MSSERTSETDVNTKGAGASGDRKPIESAEEKSKRISKDDLFHLLQNSRRRGVIQYLIEHPDQKTFKMRDIADQIAAWENGKPSAQITSKERQRVYIALYQSHLTKLDEKGVIEYKQSRGTLTRSNQFKFISSYLQIDTDESEANSEQPSNNSPSTDSASNSNSQDNEMVYYTGGTVLGLLFMCASLIGMIPAQFIPFLGLLITSLFAAIVFKLGIPRSGSL